MSCNFVHKPFVVYLIREDSNSFLCLRSLCRLDEIGFKFKIGSGRGTIGRATGSKGPPKDSEVMPP